MNLDEIHEIDLDEIEISPDNVRHHDALKDIDELAASIKKHGLLQPVVLLGEYGKPKYKLISGQRRYLAHQRLDKTRIRAVFVGQLNKTQRVVRSLVENLQRVDLDYQDTAQAITYLYKEFDKDEQKIKAETGLSIRKIRDYILIEAQATPKMKTFLQNNQVRPADVKRALRAAQNNLRKAEDLLDLIVKHTPTKYQKQRLVQYGERDNKASAKEIFDQAMKEHIEENIVISLPDDIRKALIEATKKLKMEPEELASKIVSDWLRAQSFIQ